MLFTLVLASLFRRDFDLYEILLGFALALIFVVVFSRISPPAPSTTEGFKAFKAAL
jgi:hypothetical protein